MTGKIFLRSLTSYPKPVYVFSFWGQLCFSSQKILSKTDALMKSNKAASFLSTRKNPFQYSVSPFSSQIFLSFSSFRRYSTAQTSVLHFSKINSQKAVSDKVSYPTKAYGESQVMKKLSIGIQTIDKVIGNGYVYVDKTEYARKLITSGKHYLLPRPRRFGKSFFLSTLKAIFSGNKELFKECHIYASSYEWQKHPIIHLDFTKIPTTSPKQLEIGLAETLQMIAKSYGVDIAGSSLQLCLSSLVENLSKINKIVVLVDEYDKPLIDNLAHIEVAEANRELLKSFFATLKGLDEHLRFVFITGVSKFSQVSLFRGSITLKISPYILTMLVCLAIQKGKLVSFFLLISRK